jgi:iron complex outermembrane receptor protein
MLNASDTIQYELGWKQKIPGYGNFSIAVFEADSRNEIVVNKNYSGKVVYTNANKTLRRGVELFGDFVVTKNIGLTTSYTYVLAKIANDYTTLSWSGSSINNIPTISTIAAGSYIPGAPRQKFYGDIYWKSVDKKFESALEVSGASGIVVDDINSTKSNGYAIYSARLLIKQTPGSWEINEFLRVNNIFDKIYVGSVIVNQKDLQFYEPSPGRNWVVGIKAKYKFN